MDSKYWISIVVGTIYVLTKLRKKPEEQPPAVPEIKRPQQRVQIPTTHSTKPKPLTFEELLREITEAKAVKDKPRPTTKPAYVDYDDNLGDEAQDLEEIPKSYKKQDSIYGMYEEGKTQAFSRPSLEETMKLANTDITFGKFKGFEIEEERNLLEDYTRDLKDPEGFRKAFVMSEILNRKF